VCVCVCVCEPHPIDAHGSEHDGHIRSGNRHTPRHLAVLAGIAIVRDNCGDFRCRSTPRIVCKMSHTLRISERAWTNGIRNEWESAESNHFKETDRRQVVW
jgi:hypothetical protein